MYSSSSISKSLVLVPILVVMATQLLLMRTVSSLNMTNAYLHHKCLVSQGKYKPGSLDEKNFNAIIKSLSNDTDAFRAGYSNDGLRWWTWYGLRHLPVPWRLLRTQVPFLFCHRPIWGNVTWILSIIRHVCACINIPTHVKWLHLKRNYILHLN